MVSARITDLIPALKELRKLGCTKYEDDFFKIEFDAAVVMVPQPLDEHPTRFTSEEEETEIAQRYLARKKAEDDADTFGAA